MKRCLMVIVVTAFGLLASSSAAPASTTADTSILNRAGLPTEQMAKTVLDSALMDRHPQWIEVHVYEEATHVFLYRQDLGRNWAATFDAWPSAMAFFKKHLR